MGHAEPLKESDMASTTLRLPGFPRSAPLLRFAVAASTALFLSLLVAAHAEAQVREVEGGFVVDVEALPRDAGAPRLDAIPGVSPRKEVPPEVTERVHALTAEWEKIEDSFVPDLPLFAVPDLPEDEPRMDSVADDENL
jgi:hypothetical protein